MTEREEFNRIFRSIGRYEQMDPEEIDSDEYHAVLRRYAELRNKGYGPMDIDATDEDEA